MKITKTTPENKDFFNEHGSSLGAYQLIGFIGQFLSGASLAYAVYVLLLAEVLKQGITGATTPLLAFSLLVALFIELANRILSRRAIKPFVVKGLFDQDVHLAGRHKILNNSYLVGLVAIAALSYFLSAVGSTYYAEDSTEDPALIKLDSLKEIYAVQAQQLRADFSQDSMTITGPYELRLQAARDRFVSDSLALRKEREKYRPCASAGKQWCKHKMNEYLALIDRARSAMSDSIALVSSLKGKSLLAAMNERNNKTRTLEQERSTTLLQAEQQNNDLLKEKTNDSSFKGLVFIILTIAGQTVFYLMIYLSLQVEAGSDIQHEVEPNEFWNLPSVVEEFKIMIAWRTERGLRRVIRWLFGEPGEHETAIPYKGLFDNTSRKKAASVPKSMPKSTSSASVTFIAQLEQLDLRQCKQRLKMYKKRLGSVTQRALKLEKAGKTVPQKTLKAIDNNRRWVAAYTARIQELEATMAEKKSDAI